MTSIFTPNTAAIAVRKAVHINTSKVAQYLANLLAVVGAPTTVVVASGTAPVLTLSAASYNNTPIDVGANGAALTLPAATGTGAIFRVRQRVALASGKSTTLATAPTTDVFQGLITGARIDSANTLLTFAAASNSNKISLVQSTGNGGVTPGEWIEVQDVAAGLWQVTGFLTASGQAFATPFSHV